MKRVLESWFPFRALFLVLLVLGGAASVEAAHRPPPRVPEYRLEVSFDLKQGKILGKANIHAPPDRKLTISTGGLEILEIQHRGAKVPFGRQGEEIILHPEGLVQLTYTVDVRKTDNNTVEPGNILLLGLWYPLVEGFCRFHLSVILPSGYFAVSEADRLSQTEKDGQVKFTFEFPYPLAERDGISLAASNRWQVLRDRYKDIDLVGYFFPEEAHLAPRYLERTKKVLAKYENLLGPYPYRRLALVENDLEVTQSLPTLVLLDRKELEPEDLERTPLDHEIVHQWFGGAVSPDFDRGNWCEGLAIYLADHLIQEEKGRGWQCRRRILSGFQSHMARRREFPLRDFTERIDDPTRVLGYGKGAMVFHMLRRQVGDANFFAALKDLVASYRYTVVSWEDLKKVLETLSRQNLDWFFRQWVDGVGQPRLRVLQATARKSGPGFKVTLTVAQEGGPKRLRLPITFYGSGTNRSFHKVLQENRQQYDFHLDFLPEEVVLDEDYDLFRQLSPEEDPPTLERLLKSRTLLVVPPVTDREVYREAIQEVTARGARLVENLTDVQGRGASVIFLGREHPQMRALFGELTPGDCAFSLRVRAQPHAVAQMVAVLEINDPAAFSQNYRELFAHPFYSTYCPRNGSKVERTLAPTQAGLRRKVAFVSK